MKARYSSTRRSFLKQSAVAASAVFAAPLILKAQVNGANSRIGMGFIGCGLISKGHLKSFGSMQGVQPIAVCDVKAWQVDQAIKILASTDNRDVASTPHFEDIIDNPSIDAVCVMTPDHWHAALTLAAMKAGKDVYVEKPMTLTVEEGKALVAAEKKYGRIVQVGSQQRSSIHFQLAVGMVRSGVIGDVKEIFCLLGQFPQPPKNPEFKPVPDGFDYDRWLGPTPFYEYSDNRVEGKYRGGWRCYWDYGSRKFGDWGAHHYDIVQWALGRDDTGPVEFVPEGFEGEPHHYFKYADGITVWRDKLPKKGNEMIHFVGTEGEVHVSRGKIKTVPENLLKDYARKNKPKVEDHRQNFISSIGSRNPTICPATIGHRSGTICQLAGVAQRLGRPVKWDPAAEQVVGDAEAKSMQDRPRRPGYEMPTV